MPELDLLEKKVDELFSRFTDDESVDSYRLIHGRGKCFPTWENINVDFFEPVLVLTCYEFVREAWIESVKALLLPKLCVSLSAVLIQYRYLTQSPSDVLLGVLPEKVFARRKGMKFELHLRTQQNLGFFLDMEPGRIWLEENASGKSILNLFAYTCAFSVVAIAAGAKKVVNVDMSSPALNLGRSNHQLNGLSKERSEYVAENILKSWSRVKKPGPYDLVIIDPPSFQKGSFIAEKDYAKVIRRLPELMPQGGLVLACLNAPELSEDFLKLSFSENLPSAEFMERLEPSKDFPDVDPNRQLKLLVYHLK